MRVTPKCVHQFAKREKRKEYPNTHSRRLRNSRGYIYYNIIIINSSVMRACAYCAFTAAAAGHLSSRPENASSKSVLFFRSVAAISFLSETRRRPEDYASLLLITYICLAEYDRRVKTTTKRVYHPLAPGLIYCRLPPTHHRHRSGVGVYPLYAYYIIAVIIMCVSCHSRIVEFEYLRLSRGWIWSFMYRKDASAAASHYVFIYRGRNGITLTPMPLVQLVVVLQGSKKHRV